MVSLVGGIHQKCRPQAPCCVVGSPFEGLLLSFCSLHATKGYVQLQMATNLPNKEEEKGHVSGCSVKSLTGCQRQASLYSHSSMDIGPLEDLKARTHLIQEQCLSDNNKYHPGMVVHLQGRGHRYCQSLLRLFSSLEYGIKDLPSFCQVVAVQAYRLPYLQRGTHQAAGF